MAGVVDFDAFICLLCDSTADQGVQLLTPQTHQKADQGSKAHLCPIKPRKSNAC